MTWEEVKANNDSYDKFAIDSKEYKTMESAAKNGIPDAQKGMGDWNDSAAYAHIKSAREWYQKALNNGLTSAKEAISQIDDLLIYYNNTAGKNRTNKQ